MLACQVDGVVRELVKVVGNMVETGCGQGAHWNSKVVRAVLGAVVGRIISLQDCHTLRKANNFMASWFSQSDSWRIRWR